MNADLLAEPDRVTFEVVKTALVNGLATAGFAWGKTGFIPTPYVVNQLDCASTFIPDSLDSKHPLKSAQDAADYLKRLSAYAVVPLRSASMPGCKVVQRASADAKREAPRSRHRVHAMA